MKQSVPKWVVVACAAAVAALFAGAIWWRTGAPAVDQGVSAVATLEQTPQFKAQVEDEQRHPSRSNLSKAAIETIETTGHAPQ